MSYQTHDEQSTLLSYCAFANGGSEPPAAPGGGGDLNAQIIAQGDVVRKMKSEGKPKEVFMAAVGELNKLKQAYMKANGSAWKPPPSDQAGKKKKGDDAAGKEWTAEHEKKFQLVRSVGEECVTEEDLKNLIMNKPDFNLYDGFEPSGRMHIAQGVFKAMNVNKCTAAGGTFKFWVADWFALMNDKMGGDLEKIKVVGKYLIEVWKASGMNMENVIFRWASDDITNNAATYWPKMLDIARSFNITRIKKCCQCTDIFFLEANICQLGVDQRKVNMLAREYCDAAKIKLKPIILSHHMLYGLKAGQEKMSKSDPDSAIFMEDTVEDVERKITNAYCPSKAANTGVKAAVEDAGKESMHLVEDDLKNPCLDYIQHIILCPPGATFAAGGTTYTDFASVKSAFVSGKLSEADLKAGLIKAVNVLLEPVRKHFTEDETAKGLLAQVRQWKRENLQPSNELRRLNFQGSGSGPVTAVFAPCPETERITLGQVLSLAEQLKAAPAGSQTQLWVGDWSAFVNKCFDSDMAVIHHHFTILIAALTAVAPEAMQNVQVVMQSEAILTGPSEYWISVINVGRKFSLAEVQKVDETNEQVGKVISSLMHVGDVMGTGAATLVCGPDTRPAHDLALSYYKQAVDPAALSPPEVVEVPAIVTQLKDDDADADYVLLDEGSMAKKMKKAFCEPGNADNNPPLYLAKTLGVDMTGSWTVTRSPENGGDKTYAGDAGKEEMSRDFVSGALHPGDLKNCVRPIVEGLMAKIDAHIKKDKKAAAAVKALKAAAKKAAKGGKAKASSKASGKGKGKAKAAAPAGDQAEITKLDIRVGVITKVWHHENADKLFCEEIDVGEDKPRQIASGLRDYYTLEEMQGRRLLVFCNLKARNLQGFKSQGMVLAAANDIKVELVEPPAGAKVGERVIAKGLEGAAISPTQVDKQKAFAKATPGLKTNKDRVACWEGHEFVTSAGPCTVPTLADTPMK